MNTIFYEGIEKPGVDLDLSMEISEHNLVIAYS